MTDTALNGLLLVDKPAGITSFDIIRQLRRVLGVHKIGHAGTLDPMATGLMLMLIGSATKQADRLTKMDKRYEATITLGAASSTGDKEGELTVISDRKPQNSQIDAALLAFRGEITQVPPGYSAIKINGVPAYKRMRRGETVVIPPRKVTVYELSRQSYSHPVLKIVASVSSGTYIRTLAEDIGGHLGTGAYLSDLRRTEVGPYAIEQSALLPSITAENVNNYLMKFGES
jgi:tRNA pseudouridine55 synthase